MIRKALTFVVLTFVYITLSGCATQPKTPDSNIAIWDSQKERWIEQPAMLKDLKTSNYVVIGELHKNAELRNHFISLMSELKEADWLNVVALDSLQSKLNSDESTYLEQLEKQAPQLLAHYQPIVEWVEGNDIPLVAAAIPQDKIQSMKNPKPRAWLDEQTKGALSQKHIDELRSILSKGHPSAKEQSEQLDYMQASMQLQDYFMARILVTLKQNALLVTRAFHARKDLGIEPYIKASDPSAKVKTILMISSMQDRASLSRMLMEMSEHYDYIWLKSSDVGPLIAPQPPEASDKKD